jgi:Transposase DDE domain
MGARERARSLQQHLDANPKAMRMRRETVEHPFGTLKMRMGATHFLMKRLPKVATEMALHVLAYNLTRVMNRRVAPRTFARGRPRERVLHIPTGGAPSFSGGIVEARGIKQVTDVSATDGGRPRRRRAGRDERKAAGSSSSMAHQSRLLKATIGSKLESNARITGTAIRAIPLRTGGAERFRKE